MDKKKQVTLSEILEILDQVANEVSSELDLQSVLKNTSKLVKRVVDYSSFVTATIDDQGRFNWVHQEGYNHNVLEKTRLTIDEGIIGIAVRKKEVLMIGDVTLNPSHIPVLLADGTLPHSLLAVPLINRDRAIGVIAMESQHKNAFDEEHRLMMRSIATHLAAAVTNAKLHEQTLEQIKVMRISEQIGHEISSLLDLDLLLQEIARLSRMVIDYQTFGIFLVDRKKGEFLPHITVGYDKDDLLRNPLRLDQGLRGEVLRLGRPFIANDVQNDPMHVQPKMEIDDLVRSQMYIPLTTKNKVVGIVVVGNVKKNYYTSRHLRIASGMATQIAIALENARVFEEVAESEEKLRAEFDIARGMQLSMLPDCCPQIAGFEVQAKSRPAEQVGGDFYDFIPLDGDRWGIVIGDVSGYSISGALVMASAREVMRIFADMNREPEEVMVNANARLKKDLTPHMFVALLYGVLDPHEKTFTFCNAALVEPVLVSNGRARFISSSGSRLPLGKLIDGAYEPRTVKMKPDDTLVLATDGTIEVYDADKQPFGFNRFLKTLRAAASGSEENVGVDLISAVFGELNNFLGHDSFQDDVTILTIRSLKEEIH